MPPGDWLPNELIGREIRRIRKALGDTQPQFLERIGLSPSMQSDLSKQENGHERLGEGALAKIAELEGKTVEMFRQQGVRPEVARDQQLVNRLLARVSHLSTRDAEEETGINYSVIHGWRDRPIKSTLRQETRDAVLAYLGENAEGDMGHGCPNGAQHMGHGPNNPAAPEDVREALAILQADTASARDVAAAQRAVAEAFRERTATISRLVAMFAPAGVAVGALEEEEMPGIEMPEGADAPTPPPDRAQSQ